MQREDDAPHGSFGAFVEAVFSEPLNDSATSAWTISEPDSTVEAGTAQCKLRPN